MNAFRLVAELGQGLARDLPKRRMVARVEDPPPIPGDAEAEEGARVLDAPLATVNRR